MTCRSRAYVDRGFIDSAELSKDAAHLEVNMNDGLYQKLIEVAKNTDTVTYEEIREIAGVGSFDSPGNRVLIGAILEQLSAHEHNEGRPLLSAVVILKDENIPGEGFFTLAKKLELMDEDGDRLGFFVRELGRVHDYWWSRKDE